MDMDTQGIINLAISALLALAASFRAASTGSVSARTRRETATHTRRGSDMAVAAIPATHTRTLVVTCVSSR